jgi:hypothetical protein
MELIQFIFSDFWVFIGTLMLIFFTGEAISEIVRAFRRPTR